MAEKRKLKKPANKLNEPLAAKARRCLGRIDRDLWSVAEMTCKALKRRRETTTTWGAAIGTGSANVTQIKKTWEVYGDPATRIEGLSFNEHKKLARVKPALRAQFIAIAASEDVSIGKAEELYYNEQFGVSQGGRPMASPYRRLRAVVNLTDMERSVNAVDTAASWLRSGSKFYREATLAGKCRETDVQKLIRHADDLSTQAKVLADAARFQLAKSRKARRTKAAA